MFQKVKGFRDIYGTEIVYWHELEKALARVFGAFGFSEFKLPVLERTDVFNRGIGNTTDIVEKEMFAFEDQGGESIALRPEGTASLVRAYIENGLHNPPGVKKFYYIGPMFRRERPQKGRFRQFTQAGIEVFESEAPLTDADVINLLYTLAKEVGIADLARMEINTIGCPECRPAYSQKLVDHFRSHADTLCPDCIRRLEKNPLRILDCKVDRCKAVAAEAPVILDFLCEGCDTHFSAVQRYLTQFGVPFTVNPMMVRGLDYYVRTAFELVTGELGAASAIGAGGRYDGLVKMLGGGDTPGIGFALGMDRFVSLMQMKRELAPKTADVFFVSFEGESLTAALTTITALREKGVCCEVDYELKGMKNQMKKANRSGARFAVILGEDELKAGIAAVKDMATGEQTNVPIDTLVHYLSEKQ